MKTIFKSAVSQIHASDNFKAKTEQFLLEHLAEKEAEPVSSKVRKPFIKRTIAVACSVVFVCGITLGAYAFYKMPTSYLSLDINPSVELGINAFGKVVSAMAYNNDGKNILDGHNIIDSDVKSAVSTLVKSAVKKGFVAKDGSTVISVTAETDNNTTAKNIENDAAQGADSAIKSEGDNVSIQKDNIALNRHNEGRTLGVSPGKLNLIKKLQALDPTITVDEYRDAKVTDIMKKFVELKKKVYPHTSCSSYVASYSENTYYTSSDTYKNAQISSVISEDSATFPTDEYTDASSPIDADSQSPLISSENAYTSSTIYESSETYSATNESSSINKNTSSQPKKRGGKKKAGKKSKSGSVSSNTSPIINDESSDTSSTASESYGTSSVTNESSSISKGTSSQPKKTAAKKKAKKKVESGSVSSNTSSTISKSSGTSSVTNESSSISKGTSSQPKKTAAKKKAKKKVKSGSVSSNTSSTTSESSGTSSVTNESSSISKGTSSQPKKTAAKKKAKKKVESGSVSSIKDGSTSKPVKINKNKKNYTGIASSSES